VRFEPLGARRCGLLAGLSVWRGLHLTAAGRQQDLAAPGVSAPSAWRRLLRLGAPLMLWLEAWPRQGDADAGGRCVRVCPLHSGP
jgi:hypothetical protein